MKKISECFCPTFFSISQSTHFLILLFLPLSQHFTMNIDKSLYFLLPLFFSTVPLLSLFICFFSSSQYIRSSFFLIKKHNFFTFSLQFLPFLLGFGPSWMWWWWRTWTWTRTRTRVRTWWTNARWYRSKSFISNVYATTNAR